MHAWFVFKEHTHILCVFSKRFFVLFSFSVLYIVADDEEGNDDDMMKKVELSTQESLAIFQRRQERISFCRVSVSWHTVGKHKLMPT